MWGQPPPAVRGAKRRNGRVERTLLSAAFDFSFDFDFDFDAAFDFAFAFESAPRLRPTSLANQTLFMLSED